MMRAERFEVSIVLVVICLTAVIAVTFPRASVRDDCRVRAYAERCQP
jgi:hypothetical protein